MQYRWSVAQGVARVLIDAGAVPRSLSAAAIEVSLAGAPWLAYSTRASQDARPRHGDETRPQPPARTGHATEVGVNLHCGAAAVRQSPVPASRGCLPPKALTVVR